MPQRKKNDLVDYVVYLLYKFKSQIEGQLVKFRSQLLLIYFLFFSDYLFCGNA